MIVNTWGRFHKMHVFLTILRDVIGGTVDNKFAIFMILNI